jgi:hypothetical protein
MGGKVNLVRPCFISHLPLFFPITISTTSKFQKLKRELPSTMVKKKVAASSSAAASATGSKALGAAQKSTAITKDLQCDWTTSSITKGDEKKIRNLELISADDRDVRFPGFDSRPNPPAGFTVMFPTFLFRGLSLPAHEFLRYLLFSYGIQLWQLTPISILHLAISITVCKAFLGVYPHWGLWKKYILCQVPQRGRWSPCCRRSQLLCSEGS